MLRQGIAVICRTDEEYQALGEVILREGYLWNSGEAFNPNKYRSVPIRISFNIFTGKRCMSRSLSFESTPLPYGITEVYEASDFLHNIIISNKLKGE